MIIKKDYILRKIANSDMVIPIGNNIANFNGVITLNESAAFLWKLLSDGSELPIMVEALMKEYNITKELANKDVEDFIATLQQADILEDSK